MKLLILLFTAWLASHCACAQQVRIYLTDAPFRQLLKQIEQQTGYSFIYTKKQLQLLPPVSINVANKDIFEVLNEQLNGSPLGYTIDDHFIILFIKKDTDRHTLRVVRGRVDNTSGQAIAGATVQVRNEPFTTTTDQYGGFSISYRSPNAVIQISGAEIRPALFAINERQYLEISIDEEVKELDETIIIAYGYTTRRLTTGNITRIRSSELENQPAANLLQALQGRVPGLLITATSGAPGASFMAQIRGQNSVNPNPLINNGIAPKDNPLIIINGVPFAPQNNNVNQFSSLASPGNLEIYQNPHGGISPFSSIDPADIESVEVLKDGDMTAIYGSRAANGIILITTRQPKPGKPALSMDISTGLNISTYRPSMLNTKEYLDLRRAAFAADSLLPGSIPGEINYAPDLLVFDSTGYTNWNKYFFHASAPVTRVYSRLSGGSNRLSFVSGIGYRNESSLLKGDFYNKQISLNNSLKYRSIDQRLTMEGSFYYTLGDNRSVSSPALLQVADLPPDYPALLDEERQINWKYKEVDLIDNPAGLLKQPYIIKIYNLISHFNLHYEIVTGLKFLLNAGYSSYKTNETALFPASSFHPARGESGYSNLGKEDYQTKLIEPQWEYKKPLGRTGFTVLAGATIQQNKLNFKSSKSLLNPTELIGSRAISSNYHYRSFFGRFNLQHAGKYLLNLTARREGSSRFSPDKRLGNFSSVAAGWVFSDEKFIGRWLPWISFGKFRLSYGSSGNDNIGYYHYLNAWHFLPSYFSNQGLTNGSIADAGFSWSTTHKSEAGLDLGFLKDRVYVGVSKYQHRSSDQLISHLSLSQADTARYIANFPAIVLNKGWEIMIEATALHSKNTRWSTALNLSVPQNKLRSFPGIESSLYSGRYIPGQPLGILQLIKFVGVNGSSGLYSFDLSSFTLMDTYPRLYGGFQNMVSHKRFDFGLFIEFREQQGANYLRQINHYPAGLARNQPREMPDHWQYPGHLSDMQRLTVLENSPAALTAYLFTLSGASYSNASYIRFRNLFFSYSFKKDDLKRTGLRQLKIYLQMQNIFTLTSFKQSDPEIQSFYSYSLPRTVVAGLQLQL
ncbi:MAG: SusC/RagA family TonB-linked outer membrane protein [Chitinophagaceae bacterium]